MNTPVKKEDSLFDLVKTSHQIQEWLIQSEGEMTPEIEQALTALEEKLPNKADGYKYVIDDLYAQAEAWEKRAQDFSRVAKRFNNHCDNIKERMKQACIQMGVTEIAGNQYLWKLQNNPPSVEIVSDEELPSEFKEVIQSIVPRKDLIKKALKEGRQVPGAKLNLGQHVRTYAAGKSKK